MLEIDYSRIPLPDGGKTPGGEHVRHNSFFEPEPEEDKNLYRGFRTRDYSGLDNDPAIAKQDCGNNE